MNDDDKPLDAPFVNAVVVAAEEPDWEAVHVFVAWDDVEAIGDELRGILPAVCKSMKDEPRFSGDVRFVIAREFLGDDLAAGDRLAAFEAELQAQVDQHLPTATNGRKLTVKVRFDRS